MKRSKKILALLLACFFCLGSLAACSGTDAPVDGTDRQETTAPSDNGNWPEVEGTVIYVDPAAAEGGNGSKDAPFMSVPEAQAKIREMKSGDGLPTGGITVLLASGKYSVMDAIKFTSEDSGTEECPIRYMSAEKHGAEFDGGITISPSDFEPLSDEEKAVINDPAAKDTVVKVDLTKYGIALGSTGRIYPHGFAVKGGSAGNIGPSELFVDGERMSISRYPNITDEDTNLRTGLSDGVSVFEILTIGEFEEKATAIRERALNWDLDNLWAFGYFEYLWADATVPVSLDIDALKVTINNEMYYGLKPVKPFYFFNILAETDAPGEYYIDRENAILYLCPTENFENSTVTLSVSSQNIIEGENLSYVTFDGIAFTSTRATAMFITGDHITVENCKIYNVRGDGMVVTGTDSTVQNNEVFMIGDTAIEVNGGDVNTLTPSNNKVYNNYVHHWSQIGRSSNYAIRITGCGTTVSHNEMHDAPNEAFLWNGPYHVIEYNEAYDVCLEADDCGAFYHGRVFDSYGTVIRYNYIHDVGRNGAYAHGIYYDDAISGQTAYGNVIANITGYGMLIGGGRDNVIKDNLIINTKMSAMLYDTRSRDAVIDGEEGNLQVMMDRLVIMQAQPAWLEAFPGYADIIPSYPGYEGDVDNPMLAANPANNIVTGNVYYTVDEKNERSFNIYEDVIVMSTVENNLNFSDLDHTQIPGFFDGDPTLTDDCEAYKAGFAKIPFDMIGRVTE